MDIGQLVRYKPTNSVAAPRLAAIVAGPYDNGPYGTSWQIVTCCARQGVNVPQSHLTPLTREQLEALEQVLASQ